MSLKIVLKPEEKIIINQAVIVNGKTKAEFTVENKSAILRKKDILQEEEATTPSKVLYYLIQMAYLFPETAESQLKAIEQLANEIKKAAPSLSSQILSLSDIIQKGEYYRALKECQKLIEKEGGILKNVG